MRDKYLETGFVPKVFIYFPLEMQQQIFISLLCINNIEMKTGILETKINQSLWNCNFNEADQFLA